MGFKKIGILFFISSIIAYPPEHQPIMALTATLRTLAFLILSLTNLTLSTPLHAEHATILERSDLLPEYDFIIIGAGTAGLTIGDRLSENGTFAVFVIEYGYNDTFPSIRSVSSPFVILPDFPPDSNAPPPQFPTATRMYNTTSIVPTLNNRSQAVLAGAVVGGPGAVNGMVFDRGSRSDYDAWITATAPSTPLPTPNNGAGKTCSPCSRKA